MSKEQQLKDAFQSLCDLLGLPPQIRQTLPVTKRTVACLDYIQEGLGAIYSKQHVQEFINRKHDTDPEPPAEMLANGKMDEVVKIVGYAIGETPDPAFLDKFGPRPDSGNLKNE